MQRGKEERRKKFPKNGLLVLSDGKQGSQGPMTHTIKSA